MYVDYTPQWNCSNSLMLHGIISSLEGNCIVSFNWLWRSFPWCTLGCQHKITCPRISFKMETFSFIVVLVIIKEKLAYFRDLTVSLEGKMINDMAVLENFKGSQILVNTSQCKNWSSYMESTYLSRKYYTAFIFIFCIWHII